MSTTTISRQPLPAPVIDNPRLPVQAPTDVPRAQAVEPAPQSAAPDNDPTRKRQSQPVATGFTLDQSTQDLVYQVTNTDSGTVVFQLPTDEALKARAYDESQARAKAARGHDPSGKSDIFV